MTIPSRLLLQHLQYFVDRQKEIERFQSFLETPDEFIFFCVGEGGVGKSYLSLKMELESQRLEHVTIRIDCGHPGLRDYSDILSDVVRELSRHLRSRPETLFPSVQQARKQWLERRRLLDIRVNGGVHSEVARGAELRESHIEQAIGTQLILQGDVNVPAAEAPSRPGRDAMYELTDAFFDDLRRIDHCSKMVVFVDHFERLPFEDRLWLTNEFFRHCYDSFAGRIRFVVSSRPHVQLNDFWKVCTVQAQITAVTVEVVEEYLARWNLQQELIHGAALAIHEMTGGIMMQVATVAQGMAAKLTERRDS